MADDKLQTHYPDYDPLGTWDTPDWDDQTREVVRRRLEQVPPIRFFSEDEARTLRAVVDRVIPQPERSEARRIPIVAWVDEKLHLDQSDGYRYETLPPQREAWRRAMRGLDETARALFDRDFAALSEEEQDEVLRRVSKGEPPGPSWAGMDSSRFMADLLCPVIVKIYYAHPIAWREIGYGGPSSTRGHVRKWENAPDPWEPEEKR
ncbi:MAG: gluconate 2-dehydrogenase subunit 3 family protein [Bradymonadaceae bacterium]